MLLLEGDIITREIVVAQHSILGSRDDLEVHFDRPTEADINREIDFMTEFFIIDPAPLLHPISWHHAVSRGRIHSKHCQ